MEFRKRLGPKFILIAITVNNEQLLVERIVSRIRSDEDKNASGSMLKAKGLVDQEKGTNTDTSGIRILDCIAIADIKLDNSGRVEKLGKTVFDILLKEICFKENLRENGCPKEIVEST